MYFKSSKSREFLGYLAFFKARKICKQSQTIALRKINNMQPKKNNTDKSQANLRHGLMIYLLLVSKCYWLIYAIHRKRNFGGIPQGSRVAFILFWPVFCVPIWHISCSLNWVFAPVKPGILQESYLFETLRGMGREPT